MRIKQNIEIDDFLRTVNQCSGDVYLVSSQGDRLNLKSTLSSMYISMGRLLSKEEGDSLELFCDKREDEQKFFSFFNTHPEVIKNTGKELEYEVLQ